MAANMIGVNKQIIVVQLGPFAIAMINPKIIDHHGTYETKEAACPYLVNVRLAAITKSR